MRNGAASVSCLLRAGCLGVLAACAGVQGSEPSKGSTMFFPDGRVVAMRGDGTVAHDPFTVCIGPDSVVRCGTEVWFDPANGGDAVEACAGPLSDLRLRAVRAGRIDSRFLGTSNGHRIVECREGLPVLVAVDARGDHVAAVVAACTRSEPTMITLPETAAVAHDAAR